MSSDAGAPKRKERAQPSRESKGESAEAANSSAQKDICESSDSDEMTGGELLARYAPKFWRELQYCVWTPGDLCSEEVQDRIKDGTINSSADDSTIHPTHGLIPLVRAMKMGLERVQEVLAAPGIDVNARSQDGNTALTTAAEHYPEFVPLLLKQPGIQPNIRDWHGWTALHIMVKFRPDSVDQLLAGATEARVDLDLSPQTPSDGTTPLIFAISDSPSAVLPLLQAKADPNCARPDGTTPFVAAIAKRPACLPDLVRFGVSPGIDDAQKAFMSGHVADVLPVLVSCKEFDLGTTCDDNGSTFLMVMLQKQKTDAVREALACRGSSTDGVRAARPDGATAIFFALMFLPELMALLAERGADVNAILQPSQQSALHLSATELPVDRVRAVLALLPDLEQRDSRGCTPLICAAKQGKRDSVEALLEAGADATATDNQGRGWEALLELAAREDDTHSVASTVDHEPDPAA